MTDQTAVDFSTLVGRGQLVVLNHEAVRRSGLSDQFLPVTAQC